MRILIFLTALFVLAFPAGAAEEPVIYRAASSYSITSSTTSKATTDAIGPFIRVVRVHPTEDAFILFGISSSSRPLVATAATSIFLPADKTEYFWTSPGRYIAVIRDSTDGIVYISEMDR